MAIATSLVLMAAGAILIWGVDASVAGVDLDVIGAIGIVVGLIGLAVSLLGFSRDSSPAGRAVRRDYTVER